MEVEAYVYDAEIFSTAQMQRMFLIRPLYQLHRLPPRFNVSGLTVGDQD